jgi:hypothetical protein
LAGEPALDDALDHRGGAVEHRTGAQDDEHRGERLPRRARVAVGDLPEADRADGDDGLVDGVDRAQAEINEAGKKMETELKKKGKEIEDLKNRLQREAMVLSKEVRDNREREIRIKINDLKSSQVNYRRELQNMEKKLF